MTKSLKVKILAVLLTVLLAMGGLFLANTTRVNASSITTNGSNELVVTSFVMREGASIRLGDGTEAQMGIKFSAKLSNSEYQALRVDFENVQYGVFIMPKAYVTTFGEINYDNCFGDGKIYYGPEEYKEGIGHKIHNIKTVPKYVEETDYKGYVLQGSIINMKTENLNVELIGVPYIIAELDGKPYYAFAKNAHDNVRTVVQVAQNLLDKNGYNAEDPVDEVKQGYVTRFLSNYETEKGEKFKTSYNAEFYLMNSKGEYVLDASKTTKVEDVEMSSANIAENIAADTAPALDGYVALTGLNGAFNDANEFVYDSKLLKVDGSTTLKFIYQEDKGNIFFNTSMMNGTLGWSSTVDLVSNGWSMSGAGNSSLHYTGGEITDIHYGTGLSSSLSKDAEGNYIYGQETTGRGGWKLSNIYFPTTTNKISFWCVNLGTKNASIQLFLNASAGDYGANRTEKFVRDIGATRKPRKIEIQVSKEIGAINNIQLYCSGNVYFDNFAWEKDLYVEQTLVKADAADSTNLGNLKQNVKSTKYSDSELANVVVSDVTAKALSSGTTALAEDAVVNNDGTYTLTGLESKGYYEYTFNVAYDGKTADGKGFVRANSGLTQFASFDKYSNSGTWYEGLNRDKYITDEECAKNGLLQLDVAYHNAKYGVIRGSVVNFGLINDYSLSVYPARTVNSGANHSFYLNYKNRWASGSAATAYTFKQADNMTSVCFFVYNPSTKIYNDDTLLKHSYYATAVDAEGTTVLTTAGATSSFSLGQLQPGWNYVEHNIVEAYRESKGTVNLTGLVTRLHYHVSSDVTATLLFDAYTVR